MEMKYNDKEGTLSPFVYCSTDQWTIENLTTQQISKNINLPTMEKMLNLAVDAEQNTDANPDFQQFYHFYYHFYNYTFNFEKPQ